MPWATTPLPTPPACREAEYMFSQQTGREMHLSPGLGNWKETPRRHGWSSRYTALRASWGTSLKGCDRGSPLTPDCKTDGLAGPPWSTPGHRARESLRLAGAACPPRAPVRMGRAKAPSRFPVAAVARHRQDGGFVQHELLCTVLGARNPKSDSVD